MFPQKNRLRHEQDIKMLFSKGKSIFGNVIGLKFRKNGFSDTRFAVVVGSKVAKSAVERNRIRRRFKSIFYEEKLYEQPYDCIIIVRKEAIQLPFDRLKSDKCGL